jgi:hypothetical protein
MLNGWVHTLLHEGWYHRSGGRSSWLPATSYRCSSETCFPSIFIRPQLPIIHVVSPAHRCPHGCNSCSSPRSDEFGLSKTPTKQDNPPRSSAPLIHLVCHVSISIQMTASTAQSTMYPLPSLIRNQNMTGRSRLPWIFIRAPRWVCPYCYLMITCIN